MEHFYSAGRILVKAGWLAAFELTRFQKKDLFLRNFWAWYFSWYYRLAGK